MKTSWMVLGLVAVVAAGCGDDTGAAAASGGEGGAGGSSTSPSAGGGTPSSTSTGDATTASTGSGDGGNGVGGDGAGGEGTGGEQPVDGPRGDIAITTNHYLPGESGTVLEALFVSGAACTVVSTSGGCTLSRCAVEVDDLDAGDLALSGGDLPASLEYDYLEDLNGELVTAGEDVAVSGPGTTDVPAFELGATMPTAAEATEPSFADGTIVLADDFPVAWTGGGDAAVRLTMDGSFEPEAEAFDRLICNAPAVDGNLTVPGSLLAQMVTSGRVAASLRVVATDEVEVDDWTVGLSLGRFADAESGWNGDAFAIYDIE